ncbi:hypothetical protein DFH09DRAFT_1080960 [Mycena vulgaris]|nr:hypothetical protein DFH09DRAFT_1080960 [Mycena vulgaris]
MSWSYGPPPRRVTAPASFSTELTIPTATSVSTSQGPTISFVDARLRGRCDLRLIFSPGDVAIILETGTTINGGACEFTLILTHVGVLSRDSMRLVVCQVRPGEDGGSKKYYEAAVNGDRDEATTVQQQFRLSSSHRIHIDHKLYIAPSPHGRVTQKFGPEIQWKWDAGSMEFLDSRDERRKVFAQAFTPKARLDKQIHGKHLIGWHSWIRWTPALDPVESRPFNEKTDIELFNLGGKIPILTMYLIPLRTDRKGATAAEIRAHTYRATGSATGDGYHLEHLIEAKLDLEDYYVKSTDKNPRPQINRPHSLEIKRQSDAADWKTDLTYRGKSRMHDYPVGRLFCIHKDEALEIRSLSLRHYNNLKSKLECVADAVLHLATRGRWEAGQFVPPKSRLS